MEERPATFSVSRYAPSTQVRCVFGLSPQSSILYFCLLLIKLKPYLLLIKLKIMKNRIFINRVHYLLSPEVGSEAATLLQRLREHLVLADVVVGDGASRELHRLLEVRAAYLRHRVFFVHL